MKTEKHLVIQVFTVRKGNLHLKQKKYSELFVVLYVHLYKGFLFAKTYLVNIPIRGGFLPIFLLHISHTSAQDRELEVGGNLDSFHCLILHNQ